MKLSSLLLTGILLGSAINGFSQTAPVPEFKNKVYAVGADNALTQLESTDLTSEYKGHLNGTGSINIKASGIAASVQKSGTPEEQYMVKIDADTDPSEAIELFKFTVEKKVRLIAVGSVGSMGSSADVVLPKQHLNFKKIESGVYEINATEKLAPGEYIFFVSRPSVGPMDAAKGTSLKGFAFSVQ